MKKALFVAAVVAFGFGANAFAEDAKPAAAAATMAPAATAPAAAMAASGDWKAEGKLCKTLTNRECADASEAFASTDGTVYAWTKVSGPKDGGEVHHVWFKGDEQMSDITLKIGGSPWR